MLLFQIQVSAEIEQEILQQKVSSLPIGTCEIQSCLWRRRVKSGTKDGAIYRCLLCEEGQV